jgi:hypothetical protein
MASSDSNVDRSLSTSAALEEIRASASVIRRPFHSWSESPLSVISMIGKRAAMLAPQRAATPVEQRNAATSSGQHFAASRTARRK